MPPRRVVSRPPAGEIRVPEIVGRVQRAYRVRDVAEIDAHLRGLKVWLCDAIDRAPALTRRHVEFYVADCDALLDCRLSLMRRAGPAESSTGPSAESLQAEMEVA